MNSIFNIRKHPRLALLFTALLVIFCRAQERLAPNIGPGCISYFNILEDGEWISEEKYTCSVRCPDDSIVLGEGKAGDNFHKIEENGLAKCTAATATPTATSEPQNTATPTATATLPPLIGGEVQACSLIEGYINFPLASDGATLASQTVELTWNGTPLSCEVPASNQNVLSCVLPSGTIFPAQISIHINGQLTDSFTFDGAGCVTTAPNNNDPDVQPDGGEPTCTGLPPYPEGCTPP